MIKKICWQTNQQTNQGKNSSGCWRWWYEINCNTAWKSVLEIIGILAFFSAFDNIDIPVVNLCDSWLCSQLFSALFTLNMATVLFPYMLHLCSSWRLCSRSPTVHYLHYPHQFLYCIFVIEPPHSWQNFSSVFVYAISYLFFCHRMIYKAFSSWVTANVLTISCSKTQLCILVLT